jgi:hypothetical protein
VASKQKLRFKPADGGIKIAIPQGLRSSLAKQEAEISNPFRAKYLLLPNHKSQAPISP